MTAVPIRELSHHTARCLSLVKAGETVEITERGKIIGRIIPAEPVDDRMSRLVAQGRMRPATAGRADFLADLGRRIANLGVDHEARGTAALQELRDSERY